jgi:ligand-binding sensor protein
MLDVTTLQPLLNSFGGVCGVGAGIFTPGKERIGEPANHGPVCRLMYTTREGRARCAKCDGKRIDNLKGLDRSKSPNGKAIREPYRCHAKLVDFCEPIYCRIRRQQHLIGVFFAGQILYESDTPTRQFVASIRRLAHITGLNPDKLLGCYMQVPRMGKYQVRKIKTWIRQFARLVGSLVEKKATSQQLLLDVMKGADDANEVVRAIREHLRPAAVSVFMRRADAPKNYEDHIFLAASSFRQLACRVPVALKENPGSVSYAPGEGLTGWVYKHGAVLHVKDLWNDAEYPATVPATVWRHKVKEIPDVDRSGAYLGVPIRADRNRTVGVIRAIRLRSQGAFRDDEIELLSGIGSLLSETISKAQLRKENLEQLIALKQARTVLQTLVEPDASLDTITDRIAQHSARDFFQQSCWKTVYVLQHLDASKHFRILGVHGKGSWAWHADKGFLFPDHEGVAGKILSTGMPFASPRCRESGVHPAKPWTSVVGAPIFVNGDTTLSGRRGRAAALAPVRRSNRTCSFPASGFHKGTSST